MVDGQNNDVNDEDANKEEGDEGWIWAGRTFRRLIMADERFIVVIDDAGDIDWDTQGYDWEALSPEQLAKFNLIVNRAAELEERCEQTTSQAKNKRLVAEGIARGLDGDLAAGFAMLEVASQRIAGEIKDQTSALYLQSSLLFSLPALVLLFVLWAWRSFWEVGLSSIVFWTLIASASGVFGALLSVIVGRSVPRFPPTAPKDLHVLGAACRLIGGAISGGLVGLAVKTGWLLEPLSQGAKGAAMAIISAFAAGFLEQLTASIVDRIGGHIQKDIVVPATNPEPKNSRRQRGGGRPRSGS